MNSGKYKHIKYIMLGLVGILFAFSVEGTEKIKECFFRAHLTSPAQFGPVARFEDKMFWDLVASYFEGDILYFPVIRKSVIYFGGTCQQAVVWEKRLLPIFTIRGITKINILRNMTNQENPINLFLPVKNQMTESQK